MSKIVKALIIFLTIIPILAYPKIGRAAGTKCSIETMDPLPMDFDGIVTINTKEKNCFSQAQDFTVAFYPPNTEVYKCDNLGKNCNSAPYFYTRGNKTGWGINCNNLQYCESLEGRLNLAQPPSTIWGSSILLTYFQGKKYPNTAWNVIVCVNPSGEEAIMSCKKSANIIATGTVTVTNQSSKAPPPAPADLPEIDASQQKYCTFRSGVNDVTVKVTKIYPEEGIKYQWWWDGGRDFKPVGTVTAALETEFTFTIKADGSDGSGGTANLSGFKKLCVDDKSGSHELFPRSQTQNCINFNFINGLIDPDTDRSCNLTSKGPAGECSPDLVTKCANEEPKGTYKCEAGKCVPTTATSGKIVEGCTNDPQHPAIATAIGCIHTNLNEFSTDMLRFVIGISGGLAFLMMILGAFQMLTSAGNPDTLRAGRERLTNAVIGLLIVIFAVLLLQIIGVGILNLPGFSK